MLIFICIIFYYFHLLRIFEFYRKNWTETRNRNNNNDIVRNTLSWWIESCTWRFVCVKCIFWGVAHLQIVHKLTWNKFNISQKCSHHAGIHIFPLECTNEILNVEMWRCINYIWDYGLFWQKCNNISIEELLCWKVIKNAFSFRSIETFLEFMWIICTLYPHL